MCGIFGFIGKMSKKELAFMADQNESRGGHAWGIAYEDNKKNKEMYYIKAPGEIPLNNEWPDTNCLIGHTRFATHGKPEINANNHPHVGGGILIVHNGVVSNKHKNQKTECDSEAILKMMLEHKTNNPKDTVKAIKEVAKNITGSFRIAIMNVRTPGVIYVATDDGDTPFIGFRENCVCFASEEKDIPDNFNKFRMLSNRILTINSDLKIQQHKFARIQYHYSSVDDWRKGYNNEPPMPPYRTSYIEQWKGFTPEERKQFEMISTPEDKVKMCIDCKHCEEMDEGDDATCYSCHKFSKYQPWEQ